MAITRRPDESNDEQLALDITNGDLAALRKVASAWGFLNEEAVLRYALAVLTKAPDHTLYIERDGSKVALQPSDSLKRGDQNVRDSKQQ